MKTMCTQLKNIFYGVLCILTLYTIYVNFVRSLRIKPSLVRVEHSNLNIALVVRKCFCNDEKSTFARRIW
jgi:hypothetical protein